MILCDWYVPPPPPYSKQLEYRLHAEPSRSVRVLLNKCPLGNVSIGM